jgi:hypothetical protein
LACLDIHGLLEANGKHNLQMEDILLLIILNSIKTLDEGNLIVIAISYVLPKVFVAYKIILYKKKTNN